MDIPITLPDDQWNILLVALSKLRNSSNTYGISLNIKTQAQNYIALMQTQAQLHAKSASKVEYVDASEDDAKAKQINT